MSIESKAVEHIEMMKAHRIEYARYIREGRELVKEMSVELNKPHFYFKPVWREVMLNLAKHHMPTYPPKPTFQNFKNAVDYLERVTAVQLGPITIDEVYSCCGLEDYYADVRDRQLEELELFKACLEILR